jgi:hypothetical protein
MAKEENNMPTGDPRDYFYPNQYAFNPLPYSAIEDMPVIKDLINRIKELENLLNSTLHRINTLESDIASFNDMFWGILEIMEKHKYT